MACCQQLCSFFQQFHSVCKRINCDSCCFICSFICAAGVCCTRTKQTYSYTDTEQREKLTLKRLEYDDDEDIKSNEQFTPVILNF